MSRREAEQHQMVPPGANVTVCRGGSATLSSLAHLHHVHRRAICVWISIDARGVAARADQVDRVSPSIDDVEVAGGDARARVPAAAPTRSSR